MYVTDIPRIDRMTDPILSAVGDALEVLEVELGQLDLAVWKMEQAEEAPEGLQNARDAVLSASEGVTEALGRLGIEAL